MPFVVRVSHREEHTRIHREDCPRNVHRQGGARTEWFGPFETLVEAESKAGNIAAVSATAGYATLSQIKVSG